MPERSELSALRDPTALAAGQYATGANLADRSALHDRFSSTPPTTSGACWRTRSGAG